MAALRRMTALLRLAYWNDGESERGREKKERVLSNDTLFNTRRYVPAFLCSSSSSGSCSCTISTMDRYGSTVGSYAVEANDTTMLSLTRSTESSRVSSPEIAFSTWRNQNGICLCNKNKQASCGTARSVCPNTAVYISRDDCGRLFEWG
jgi:hypothetical protein